MSDSKARPSYRTVQSQSNVGAAVADAFSALQELGAECREVVDNASAGLAATARIETLGESADALEGIQEPDIPEAAEAINVTITEQKPYDKRRSPSRSVRCSNACSALEVCYEALKGNKAEAMQELAEEIHAIIEDCESLEFPGMFGG